MKNDKQSAKRAQVAPIKSAEAIDQHTVRIVTNGPTADLLEYLTDHVLVMQKRLIESYGDREADRNHPYGFGPYKLKELVVGNRVVLEKNPDWKELQADNPDIVIYRLMREPEQRVTALLNDEIQIAQFVPPHLTARIESSARHRVVKSGSIEMMFLAMMPKRKWESRELRQAVAYAIDREAIIKAVLQGQARVLHGPFGPGQYAYDPNLEPEVQLQSREGPRPGQTGRISGRRRRRAIHPGRPLHQRQADIRKLWSRCSGPSEFAPR